MFRGVEMRFFGEALFKALCLSVKAVMARQAAGTGEEKTIMVSLGREVREVEKHIR